MAMELYINGVQQTNFVLSAPYKDTIDEELDQLNFQIKSETRLTFNKNDKVRYVLKQRNSLQVATYTTLLDKIFCLFNYKESLSGMLWIYQITCLSPTKLLENIFINGMAETRYTSVLTYSLGNQAVRLKNKINNQLYYEGVGITLSVAQRVGYLTNRPKDFLWAGQVNVREIFNDVFSVADAIVIGTDFTTENGKITEITIDYQKRNAVGSGKGTITNGEIQNANEVVKGVAYTRDSEFACGNIISLIKNGVAKDNIQQAYLPARNTDLTIDDSAKWQIITQEPIYTLNKVYVIMAFSGLELEYPTNETPSTRAVVAGIPVDITNYIVEKSVFDAMSLAEQKTHAYFIRGQKNIYGLYDKYKSGQTGLFSDTAIYSMLYDAISINTNGWHSYFNLGDYLKDYLERANAPLLKYTTSSTKWSSFPDTYVDENGITRRYIDTIKIGDPDLNIYPAWANSHYTSNDLKQCMFSINYQPYVDSAVKIEKTNVENIEANSQNLSVIRNQSDRTIDMAKYYDSQKSFVDRMGNKEMYVDSIVDLENTIASGITTLWGMGDYFTEGNDTWKVVQRTFELYGENKIKINYKLSKNYNASNLDIELKRDKRLYGIPLDNYVDRYIILKNNIHISPNFDNIDKIFIECWDDFTDGGTTKGYCIMEAVKIGNGTIIDKVARCLDNYTVDIERTKYSSTIVNVNLRYCDVDGYADNIRVMGLPNSGGTRNYNSLVFSDYSRLPFIFDSGAINNIDNGIVVLWTEYESKPIYKDKMERLIFVVKQ